MGHGSLRGNRLCPESPARPSEKLGGTKNDKPMGDTQSSEPCTTPEAVLKIRTGLVIKYSLGLSGRINLI